MSGPDADNRDIITDDFKETRQNVKDELQKCVDGDELASQVDGVLDDIWEDTTPSERGEIAADEVREVLRDILDECGVSPEDYDGGEPGNPVTDALQTMTRFFVSKIDLTTQSDGREYNPRVSIGGRGG